MPQYPENQVKDWSSIELDVVLLLVGDDRMDRISYGLDPIKFFAFKDWFFLGTKFPSNLHLQSKAVWLWQPRIWQAIEDWWLEKFP